MFSLVARVSGTLLLACISLVPLAALAQMPRDLLIEMEATTSSSVPHITLSWLPVSNVTAPATYPLYRRVKGTSPWSTVANLNPTDTTYADTTAQPGVVYEYSLTLNRTVAPAKVYGAIAAGHEVPLIESRGHVLVLVDDTVAGPLTAELAQLQADLAADGWVVHRLDTPREQYPNGDNNPANYIARRDERLNLRTTISNLRAANSPSAEWALLIIGHVPVAYSGFINPDGHPEHFGAWPTDGFYGELDATWPDAMATTYVAGTRPENINIAGDGKFDRSEFGTTTAAVDLQVGRVDLYHMSGTTLPRVTEVDLLRQYLVRNHRFRTATAPYDNVARRMIIDDDIFQYAGGEAFSGGSWRAGINLFGRDPGEVDAADWFSTLQTTPMLMASGTGPGDYDLAASVAASEYFATMDSKAVFNLLFGSYFGDWDNANALLKAPLASRPGSLGLAAVWSGRPWTHLNHMALGESIGYCVRFTQRNTANAMNWFQNDYFGNELFDRWIHIGLMGDPTLRLHSVKNPTGLTATSLVGGVQLAWAASPDAAAGYHVYRATSLAGPFTRLTGSATSSSDPAGSPIPGLTYTDKGAVPGTDYVYRVKAVRVETTPSGTYVNQGLGAVAALLHLEPGAEPPPAGLDADPGAEVGSIQVTWGGVVGASSYVLQRAVGEAGPFETIATPADPTVSYLDEGLQPGVTYYYRVRALAIPDDTGYSEVASAQPYLPATLEGWRYRHFLTTADSGDAANTADPDQDSLENLKEYILGENPQGPLSSPPPVLTSVHTVEGQPRLTLTFIRNKAATDVTLSVKVGDTLDAVPTDLDPLSPANQLQVLDNVPTTGLETITVKDTQSISATDARYMRLSVEE